jgi:ABC-type cobalamin/Fe3+-siderophores transport system ATPase subunit
MKETLLQPIASPLLKVENLEFRLGKKHFFTKKPLSFELRQGERLFLIGENGSGKTSLLKALAGLLKPVQGSVLWHGETLIAKNFAQQACVRSWLPQNLKAVEDLNVSDFLHLGERDAHVESFILYVREAFDLESLWYTQLTQLSGGQWKWVQLARVWAQRAWVALLDEPSVGLDLAHMGILYEKLRLLSVPAALNPHALIVTTHDFSMLGATATHVLAMTSDEIVFFGEVADYCTGCYDKALFGTALRWRSFLQDDRTVWLPSL